jgi:hypothetical protein
LNIDISEYWVYTTAKRKLEFEHHENLVYIIYYDVCDQSGKYLLKLFFKITEIFKFNYKYLTYSN